MNNEEQRDIFYLTPDEMNLLDGYRELKKTSPKSNFLIMDPNHNKGYNLKTGKKIRLVEEEYEDD